MAGSSISFSVEVENLLFLDILFADLYGRYNTIFFPPIYIIHDVPKSEEDGHIEKREHSYYRVVEANEDPDQDFKEIAKIFMLQYSAEEIHLEFQRFQESKNRWYQVEKLVRLILKDVHDMDYKIISVIPKDLIPVQWLFTKNELKEIGENAERIHKSFIEQESSFVKEPFKSIEPFHYKPKREKYLIRWKKAYAIFIDLDEIYFKDWEENPKNNPKPKLEDYRDYLANSDMKWKPSIRTIERIIAIGKAEKW